MLGYERRDQRVFAYGSHIEFLLMMTKCRDCMTFKEYEKTEVHSGSGSYIFEFMRISREITPFNTVGHIARRAPRGDFRRANSSRGTDIPDGHGAAVGRCCRS